MTNREKFAAEYAKAIAKAINERPDEYAYPESEIPGIVAKMVPALADGNANLGPAAKSAARACGIKPTLGAIKSFLNS